MMMMIVNIGARLHPSSPKIKDSGAWFVSLLILHWNKLPLVSKNK
jgi:hypothetical protein